MKIKLILLNEIRITVNATVEMKSVGLQHVN